MKPFTNKHSAAAGSPFHMGGSYKKSPLEQRVQPLGPEPTGAEAYYTPPGYVGTSGGYNLVGNITDDYEDPFTPEQLATRIDLVSGDPLDYNTTSGTVEIQGSDSYNGLRPRKAINLEGLSKPTLASRNQRAQRNAEVPITNREMATNTWSATNRENYPRQTRSKPVATAGVQDQRFDINRRRDSLGTMNNRNFVATNQRLKPQGKYLKQEQLSEELINKFGFKTR
mgnify:CR=1 FL=1